MSKFLSNIIPYLFFISTTLQIASEYKHKLNAFNLDINVDYNQATQTVEQLKILQVDYQGLKQKIVQNETKEYSQCLDFVVALQCQKMDIWQAEIQELEIENKNSEEVQIPFLQQRKTSKIEKLKELLEITSESDLEKQKLSSELEGNKKKVQNAVNLLQQIYQVNPKSEFVQRFSNQMKDLTALEIKHQIQNAVGLLQIKNHQQEEELNEKVDSQLNTAHLEYLEKDQQIQAQTTVNIIQSSESKINEAVNLLSQSYESKLKELKLEKKQLKEDIEQLRTQIQQFQDKVKHNTGRIEELQGKVTKCVNKPQNKEHDCDPIKEKAKKQLIEVEMMISRLNLIEEQLNLLSKGKDKITLSSSKEEEKRKKLLEEFIKGKEILANKSEEPINPQFQLQGEYRDVGAEAIGDYGVRSNQEKGINNVQAGMKLENRDEEYKFKKGTIEYDGRYLKDLKGYKQYDD